MIWGKMREILGKQRRGGRRAGREGRGMGW